MLKTIGLPPTQKIYRYKYHARQLDRGDPFAASLGLDSSHI
ncbi:hypothetical protein C4K00_4335 [Pseudomonas synxantha]|nr:hypothetical protein C4K00_4335 [Pseudomonas synxantha]